MKRSTFTFLIVCFICFVSHSQNVTIKAASSKDDSITWEIPIDGGTPRDAARITKTAPGEYHIQAAFEDGGESVLKHAVSRMDIICNNNGPKPVLITLHIDLSGDGKRTDYDTKPESGMKLRDFIFIKSKEKDWQQVNGKTEGWVSVVQFEAVAGNTQIGLSPWYTYADYLSFVGSLQQGSYLEKRMIGRSDEGREHWELTITDTSIRPDKKRKIFWQAREHAYETFSSFAMEGLIPFLLSDKAAAFRKHYIITIHPMTNIDGVAKGYEYRAGYDFSEARGTNTGKISFETMDRLRPEFAVAWHNWIAPRDRNVVFFTDGMDGKATTRVWLRFTQLFPSLHQWGHRWKDEDTPEKYNWQDKAPGGGNIHSYGHRTYGTSIWGWEMPWWNLSVDEARNAGAAFGFAFLTTLDEIQTGRIKDPEVRKTIDVPQFQMNELVVKAKANVANPSKEAMLVGIFTSPGGKRIVVDGYYAGNRKWKIRFTPDEPGNWTYLLRGEGVDILQMGTVNCRKQ